EFRHSALASSCLSNQRDALTGADSEIEVDEHWSAFRIRKHRMLESDLANSALGGVRLEVRRVLNLNDRVQQTLQPFCRNLRRLKSGEPFSHFLDRSMEQPGVLHKCDEIA